jgi:hypothetical protein
MMVLSVLGAKQTVLTVNNKPTMYPAVESKSYGFFSVLYFTSKQAYTVILTVKLPLFYLLIRDLFQLHPPFSFSFCAVLFFFHPSLRQNKI